jgi:hypothetical protein
MVPAEPRRQWWDGCGIPVRNDRIEPLTSP